MSLNYGFSNFKEIPPGYILNAWFYKRMMQNNKNVLIAIIGKTGSGKSWCSLSICEQWYQYKFKKQFPVENVCFSIDEITQRLLKGKLNRGDLLILEEGGVNLSSLDFQNKMVKTFTFVLQSFRSMNVGLIINLPYFSMLNKQTRMLMHMLLETMEIDKATNEVILKPLHLQYNQRSGNEYFHYPKVMVDGTYERVQRLRYPAPSMELVTPYEERKQKFVLGVVEKVEEINTEAKNKNFITEIEAQCYYLRYVKKLKFNQIADILDFDLKHVAKVVYRAEKKGLTRENIENHRKYLTELDKIDVSPLLLPASNQL